MRLSVAGQGFLGVSFRKALLGATWTVYGNGDRLRDPVYVDDAVNAVLRAGQAVKIGDRYFNIEGYKPLPLREIANCIAGRVESIPFPDHLEAVDIGRYSTDSSQAAQVLGWQPTVSISKGTS